MKIKGMKELQKQLKNMERGAKELQKTKSASFDELFIQSFMRKNTQFNSFDEFLTAGNFIVETQEDFEAIPDEDMDQHVAKTTTFKDWQTMLDTAASEYALRKLGF